MRNFLSVALIFTLIIVAARGANAQVAVKRVQNSVEVRAITSPIAPLPASADELLSMLPPSDLIAMVNASRAFNDLLPKLAGVSGGVGSLVKSIQEFSQKTGIDPSKIQNAAIGFNLDGAQGSAVAVVQGINPDPKQIEAAMKEVGGEYKTSDYKGKTIYNLASKVNTPSAGPLSFKTDEIALTALGNQRMALGDLTLVKQVIDIQGGAAKGGVSPAMAGALNETRASALIRFAMNIPEGLRTEAANQGDLFKSIATIKIILGTFDVTNELNLSLDAIIRTNSQNDAVELENGLKGLISLGRDLFAGGDPKTNVFAQVLNQVKIASKANDVSLVINLPHEALEQLAKPEASSSNEKK